MEAQGLKSAEAISSEVNRFTTATGIPCALEMPPELNVSERNGEHALRCVSEGLANVARHAWATQVWVSLGEENGHLLIKIRDNGRGFDAEDSIEDGHYGLLGLRERARLANGELTVDSQPGAGTTLCMTIPPDPKNGASETQDGEDA